MKMVRACSGDLLPGKGIVPLTRASVRLGRRYHRYGEGQYYLPNDEVS
jgi:hypothetical protein